MTDEELDEALERRRALHPWRPFWWLITVLWASIAGLIAGFLAGVAVGHGEGAVLGGVVGTLVAVVAIVGAIWARGSSPI